MKKLLFLVPAFALAMGSCTNDIPGQEEGDFYDGPLETNYLAVNITNTGTITRGSDGNLQDDYENGSPDENQVKSIRFYFFDAFDKSVRVVNATGTLTSYLDWNDTDEEDGEPAGPTTSDPEVGETTTIEKIVSTKLVIQTPKGDRVPETAVAVVNPTDQLKTATINDLQGLSAYASNFKAEGAGKFVMSNSVYVNDGVVMKAVNVKEKLQATADAATADPAIFHVERVNAKVRMSIDNVLKNNSKNVKLGDNTILYNTGVENTSGAENSDIYVKLLGWEVVSTPQKSFLVKNIEPTWTNTGLFESDIWNWNSAIKHRSFWAINPELTYGDGDTYVATNDYYYANFAGIQKNGFEAGNAEKLNYTYVQENAAVSATSPAPAHPTQVVIAGLLTDKDGNALEIAEWATNHYTTADLLANLANYAAIYKVTEKENSDEEGKEYEYEKLGPSYFKFVAAEDLGKASYSEEGRYQAYLQLDVASVEDMQLTTSVGGEVKGASAINEALANSLLPAKIWTEGKTYFYFPIQHLGDAKDDGTLSPAYYGVVRNHIYDSTITALSGLGTPVFDGEKVIIPEKPEKEVAYIAAKINILQWRIVKKNIELSW